MQDFERWVKGELQRRNRNFYRTEGDADFRERVSRSIWPSKLCLSCDKFLPARVVLSFGGKVRLLLYVFAGWGAVVFCRKSSLLATFLNAAFAGDVSPTRSAPHKYRIYRVYFSSVSRTAPFPFTISAKYWHTRSASPASFRSTPKISLSVSSG